MLTIYFNSKKNDEAGSEEEGEVKEEPHPLVTVTNIDPEEIPDVPFNKFLMRGGPQNQKDNKKDPKRRG